MANQLKVAVVHAIEVLLERGWSHRRVAGVLGIDRGTVAGYARRARERANPAKAPPGSDEAPTGPEAAPAGIGGVSEGTCTNSKPATQAPPGSGGFCSASLTAATAIDGVTEAPSNPRPANQTSQCEPFREIIKGKLDQGLTAKRIHQDLVSEHGFTAKYHSVRRFVARLGNNHPLPFRRMECAPGEEAQIDFGTGAPIIGPDGRRRRTHVLRVVLSHSRKAYSESLFRQTTEDFIRALENAFHHFGGVPKTLVPDNLKAAVIKADWFDPDLNPKIQEFCRHYDTVLLPAKPRMARHKGKVEAGVKFVQSNALKGRTFTTLADQNRFLLDWETSVADTRIHGTTRKQVAKLFQDVERPALLPLPVERFRFFHEAKRSVHRDGHVAVDRAYYSVPAEYLGRQVWVRWDSRRVQVFDLRMQEITVHLRRPPGQFSTHPQHIAAEKISGVERGAAYLMNKASLIGPRSTRWAESMLQERGIQGVRVLQGLLSLTSRYRDQDIEQACEIAQSHGAYRLRVIRELIKRRGSKQDQFEFMDEHPIIRNLGEYQQFVQTAFQEANA
jgi:transposase